MIISAIGKAKNRRVIQGKEITEIADSQLFNLSNILNPIPIMISKK